MIEWKTKLGRQVFTLGIRLHKYDGPLLRVLEVAGEELTKSADESFFVDLLPYVCELRAVGWCTKNQSLWTEAVLIKQRVYHFWGGTGSQKNELTGYVAAYVRHVAEIETKVLAEKGYVSLIDDLAKDRLVTMNGCNGFHPRARFD